MLPTSARKAPDSSALEVEGMSGGSFYGGGGRKKKAEQTPKPDEEEEKKDSKKKEVSSKKKKKALVRQRSASFGRSGEAGRHSNIRIAFLPAGRRRSRNSESCSCGGDYLKVKYKMTAD